MSLYGLHPFQNFELEGLPAWRHLAFNNEYVTSDEEAVNEIEAAFQHALRTRNLSRFVSIYIEQSRGILAHNERNPLVYEILCEALARLVFYYLFLTRRGRSSLAGEHSSVCTWVLHEELLRYARSLADELEQTGKRTSDYYPLTVDKPLSDWVREHVRPLIESYVGSSAVAPHAHLRVVTTELYGHTWDHRYADHPFGDFHWDELCYSIPLIIYLDDVQMTDGPYSYVEGSDKLPQNLTVRAFTQAITCRLLPSERIDDLHREAIAALPRIFRGGERVGSHLDRRVFESADVRSRTGAAGTAILAHGFSLVHSGGHPSAGRRRALFVAHRYPRKKVLDCAARAAKIWFRSRVRQPQGQSSDRVPPHRGGERPSR
jgi:hypothetical protein